MAKKLNPTYVAIAGALAGLAGYHRYKQIKPGDVATVPVEAVKAALQAAAPGNPNVPTLDALYQAGKPSEPVRVRVIAVTGGTFTANPMLGDNTAVPVTLTLPVAQATNTTPGLFAKK